MTGATSTIGGGGGAAARTLLLLHPSALSSNTALTNPVVILFIFQFSFSNRVAGASERRR